MVAVITRRHYYAAPFLRHRHKVHGHNYDIAINYHNCIAGKCIAEKCIADSNSGQKKKRTVLWITPTVRLFNSFL